MRSYRYLLLTVVLGVLISSCTTDQAKEPISFTAEEFHHCSEILDEAVINDFFSPPVASRIYAYSYIAAYEVLASLDSTNIPFAGQLHDLKPLPAPESDAEINSHFAALWAFSIIGKNLVYSEFYLDTLQTEIVRLANEKGMTESVVHASMEYAELCTDHLTQWIDGDQYKMMRSWDIFTPSMDSAGAWIPTPPDYFDAMEPHWPKLRTLVIDSASQFRPDPPTPFSLEEGSPFYLENIEVFEAVLGNDSDRVHIAKFWDDAPFQPKIQGHAMSGEKKLTPPGHWLSIIRNACKANNYDLTNSIEAYSLASVVMFDAIISCWDAKYHYNYIRPVTVLQQIKDPLWMPILYTPNFPEYTSGHSVFSGSASTVAEFIFSDQYSFIDSSEYRFGLEPRSFNSFADAADEAAMSRMYGGIHFTPSIVNGVAQGREVGKFILDMIETRP
jgi:hypothetical protein